MRRYCLALTIALSLCASRADATAFYSPTYGVAVTSNVTYGTGLINNGSGSLNLLLDVYRPTFVGTPLPAQSPGIVFIHGGAWQSGSKTDSYAVAFGNYYASLGYVVSSINYRMLANNVPATSGPADLMTFTGVPDAAHGGFDLPLPATQYTVNAGIEDAAKAVGWMRDNAATYNIDTSHVAISGASAGAINSLAHAYNNPSPHFAAQSVVSYVGALIGAESIVDAGEVPALLINGALDPLIPPIAPQTTVAQMNSVGVYNEFYMQPGVGHTVDFNMVFGGRTLQQINDDFFRHTLVPEPSTLVLAAVAAAMMACMTFKSKSFRAR